MIEEEIFEKYKQPSNNRRARSCTREWSHENTEMTNSQINKDNEDEEDEDNNDEEDEEDEEDESW